MRQSGILLHITSLPSKFGIGDLGPEAHQFLSFLKDAGQSVWQVLPLNPTDGMYDHSPYSSPSAFAVNPLLISPESLVRDGLLREADFSQTPCFDDARVDFDRVARFKQGLLDKAFRCFQPNEAYEKFVSDQQFWLKEYALFTHLKKVHQGEVWSAWPEEFKDAHPESLDHFMEQHQEAIDQIYFEQFIFLKQWAFLHQKARELGIALMGDIPIYVNYDSVDVWTHPQVFKLNEQAEMDVVAGVPPDYFSAEGQRWGNPVYHWVYLQETNFEWWIERLRHNLNLSDILRIDHFRAFVNYWEIPADETSAKNGYWVDVPTDEFFAEVKEKFADARLIAEDLGQMEPEVIEKIQSIGYPGMKVLMFAFGEDLKEHMYLPHNYNENAVVYTGTHDNNTVRGWYDEEAAPHERKNFLKYINHDAPAAVHLEMIQLAMDSQANLCLIPMQDVLGLGQEARMNRPGTGSGNWRWRVEKAQLNRCVAQRLAEQTFKTHRSFQ